ncbi:MAG: adenylate/guanylate cyclase domain-containing protein [Deltaproteobacteria bacterium]|nr:adenylate/guanylate cyclase domain-containing protein [Deltaproteobacteria bacterium]
MNLGLAEGIETLRARGVKSDLCERLASFIREGAPAELLRIAPPRLALAWNVPDADLLDAFLLGTRIGLFELEWDVRCPSCTGPTAREQHLAKVPSESECPRCDVHFSSTFDESIEVTWRVHPAIRDLSNVDPNAVFSAYFASTLVESAVVEPRGSKIISLELLKGNYHLAAADRNAQRGLRVTDEGGSGQIDVAIASASLDRGPPSRAAGRYDLRVANRSDSPTEFVIARVTDRPWVSAARLAAHQSFRDLFSRELISPDETFAIRSAAFVFTDLKGSTELYERIGDARAYPLVRDHFRIMSECVRRANGAIVKTIGDAILATFLSAEDAVRFALEMSAAFEEFNTRDRSREEIVVKVGIHAGPCIVVTQNETIDYFGRTLNTAARIQGLSRGHDIVLSDAVARGRGVSAMLSDLPGWSREDDRVELKGIASAIDVVRLTR